MLSAGAEKVAINTFAVENPQFVREAADVFGSSTIVISIDARKKMFGSYEVYTHGGRKGAGLDPVKFAVKMETMGAGEIMINAIDRDGTMAGYDIDLIKRVAKSVTIPIIACGGMGKLSDIAEATREGKASAAAAGSYFVYHGKRRAVLLNFPSHDELNALFQEYQTA